MMDQNERRRLLAAGAAAALRESDVGVPQLLLRMYRRLKLSDVEAMLLIHLISFVDKEKKDFPTLEEIESRMSSSPDEVVKALQRLMKEGFVAIDEGVDPISGIRFERYNLGGLQLALAEAWAAENVLDLPAQRPSKPKGGDIFTLFEKEFARPLTPMELETISSWLDQDQYKEELILAALKEAVFAGKVHFRYIDRILLEWSRNRVFTVEQAKEYTQKFRGQR